MGDTLIDEVRGLRDAIERLDAHQRERDRREWARARCGWTPEGICFVHGRRCPRA